MLWLNVLGNIKRLPHACHMKYISYLKILNIAVHNYYTECCFLCQIVIFQMFLLIHFSLKKDK